MSELKSRTPNLPGQRDMVDPGMVRRPIRSATQEVVEMVTSKEAVMITLFMAVTLMLLLPLTWMLLLPFVLSYYGIVASRKYRLPFKLPQAWGGVDYGAPKPGGNGYAKAGGILFFGHDAQTGEQLWIENGDARRHGFFLGTTGSGKALPLDTPVLTPQGWVMNGDLRPGDRIVHPDGTSATVHSVHPQGAIPAVRVWFADGREAVCSMDHLWQVRMRPRNGMMPAGMEEQDEVRTAGDLGILVGLRGDEVRVSVPLAAPAPMEGSIDPDAIDFPALIRDGMQGLDIMPSTRGTPEQRLAFLRHWAAASGTVATRETEVLRLHRLRASDARILKQIAWSLGGTATTMLRPDEGPDGEMDLLLNFPGMEEIWPQAEGLAPIADLEIIRIDRLEDDLEMSCIKTDREDGLYVMEGHVVTHNTELLLGVVSQTLMWSSGFLFIDGKGTTEFYARAWTLCKRFGREDDIRVLNFTDAGGDPDAPAGGPDTQSNTVNPFAKGGADQLMNIVVSLMGDAGQGNDMWKNRAMSLVTAEMKALCELRDSGDILLNVQTIRDFLFLGKGFDKETLKKRGISKVTSIEQIPEAAWEELRGRAGLIELYLRAINRDFSEATYLALKGFFDTLPGFSLDKAMNGDPQDAKCLEQYGFLSMQLTKPLGSLADDYGHIFRTPLGEVDIDDVVLNRRILVVLLPALQKAPEEMQNCGKIVVTLCKIMMGNASGFMLQGSRQEIVESKQTRAPSPYIVVLDEAGYYMVSGIDVMMAQARSLGFMIIVAGQDMAAMQKTSPQIAETAAANASIFAAGKTVDGEKTVKFIQAVFGRTQVAVTSGYTQTSGLFTDRWVDRRDASIQEVEKVKIEELQNMMEGEFYFLFNGSLVKAATFYIGDNFADQFAVNKFIKVRGPTDRVPGLDQTREEAFLKDYVGATSAFASLVRKELDLEVAEPEDSLARVLERAEGAILSRAAEGSLAPRDMLLCWRDAMLAEQQPGEADEDEDEGWSLSAEVDGLTDGELLGIDPSLDDPIEDMLQGRAASGEDQPGEALARGMGRVARGRTPDERAGGLVDILVAQDSARETSRRSPVVHRYVEEANQRVQREAQEKTQTIHEFFAAIAENSQRLSRLFSEENVQGQVAMEILRRTGSADPLPLSNLPDESRLEGVVSELEKFLVEKGG